MINVSINPSELKRIQFHEYAIRFFFGGAITLAAGIVAKEFGPVVGGLFLAFPAIFPASATLVDKHERQKKKRVGIQKTKRGRQAAALDARGAADATLGLIGFAMLVWYALPKHAAPVTLAIATVVWGLLSVTVWYLRKIQRRSKASRPHM